MRAGKASVAVVVAVGGAVRFVTIGVQPHWIDEAYTLALVRLPFREMVGTVSRTESTPHLYYLLAWGWARLFGSSDVAVRSLSAIFGTATIAVAYLLGRELVGELTGLLAAVLVAANPFLVWYSQEARAYALMILASAVSLLFTIRAIRHPNGRELAGWAAASAVAIASHYFAVFLVAPEALLLLRATRAARFAVAAVVVVAGALAPLALHQRKHDYGFGHVALATRVAQLPKQFLVGFGSAAHNGLALAAIGLAVYGAWWSLRDRRVLLVVLIAAAALLLPLALAVVGADVFDAKNSIAVLVPCLVALAAGYARARGGLVTAAALACIFAAVIALTATDKSLQRIDWRTGCEKSRGQNAPSCHGTEAGLLKR